MDLPIPFLVERRKNHDRQLNCNARSGAVEPFSGLHRRKTHRFTYILAASRVPERNLVRNWGQSTISNAAFLAAYLIKLEEGRDSMGDLLLYLQEHPALIWLLGFPLTQTSQHPPFGFDPQASLPTERHMARMLRHIPNSTIQHLFNEIAV
jgi:hypothetical protein